MKNDTEIEKLKFPIGHFDNHLEVTAGHLAQWKITIAAFPGQLRNLTEGLSVTERNWKYRPEGWSVKQVVHHLADSHMNSIIRLKLTLTENAPTIRPYEESLWAQLADGLSDDIETSLRIIEGVHARWSQLLESLSATDWDRIYFHPEHQRLFSVKESLGIYDWHCRHHLAHIEQALSHKGTFNL